MEEESSAQTKFNQSTKTDDNSIKTWLRAIIFFSKWFLIPFYLGLIVALIVYMYVDIKSIADLVMRIKDIDKEESMLMVLNLLDIVMIANLVKMITTGSYTSFVDKEHNDKTEKVSSGTLKVKMGMSIIGVSSVNILQSFINAKSIDWETIQKQALLHGLFLIGGVILALIDFIHVKAEVTAEIAEKENKHE